MVISIRSNSTSSTTARQASDAQEAMKKSMERTATGLRINKAADDAAGLAIAAQMTAELNGLFQASRNARDAVSLVQTAEGGLSEIGGMVDRLRTLAIQSASDVLGPQERQAIQQEVNQLEDEIGRVVGTTAFNGRKLLDGSMTSARFQIGPQAGQEVSIALDGVQVPNIDLTSFDGASRAITFLDTAVKALHDQQATLGATQNRLSRPSAASAPPPTTCWPRAAVSKTLTSPGSPPSGPAARCSRAARSPSWPRPMSSPGWPRACSVADVEVEVGAEVDVKVCVDVCEAGFSVRDLCTR